MRCLSCRLPGPVSRGPGKKRGAIAAVEFALVAPLLFLFIIGMFEISRGMQVKAMLNNAARKGCRTGIQRNKGDQDIYNDVMNIMADNGFDTTRFNPPPPPYPNNNPPSGSVGFLTVTVTDPSGNNVSTGSLLAPEGSQVSVQVGIPTSSINWNSSFFLTKGMVESETVVMMKQ